MEKVKITFLMLAFNSKRFIKESIESVLNQSEKNIRLVIRNNASTDETGDICKAFLKKDSRITYMENKTPFVTDDGIQISQREWWPLLNSEYVATIDHDDILDLDFAKKMYQTASKYQTDITVCGNYFFSDDTGEVVGVRTAADFNTKDMFFLGEKIEHYYGLLRTMWGKIYRTDFFDSIYQESFSVPDSLKLSIDTYWVFNTLKYCKSFACVENPLYYYRISGSSQFNSSQIKKDRIGEADILFAKAREFLQACNAENIKTLKCLYSIHWGHMGDLMDLITRSTTMSIQEKLEFIQDILKNSVTAIYAESNIDFILESVFKRLKVILANGTYKVTDLYGYFIYRIYKAHMKAFSSSDGLLYLTVLSGVLDTDNIHKIGRSLLNTEWGSMSEGHKYFMKLSMENKMSYLLDIPKLRDYLAWPGQPFDFSELEDELIKAVDMKKWAAAKEFLAELNQKYPIDEYAVYYRMYISFMEQDMDFACEQAYISKVLWRDSPEIIELSQLVLDNI